MVAGLSGRPPASPYADPALEIAAGFLAGARVDPRSLPWQGLKREDLRLVRAWLAQSFSPQAARRLLLSLRRAVRHARREDDTASETPLSEEQLLAATRWRMGRPAGRALGTRARRLLFEACAADATPAGRRDAAIIALLLRAGLERAALCRLRPGDYDEAAGLLRAGQGGSGRVRSAVILRGESRDLLEVWLRAGERGNACLFTSRGGRPLSPAAVSQIVGRRAREAGIGRLTPGELRACFLADLRGRTRRSEQPPAVRLEDEDGRPALLYHSLD